MCSFSNIESARNNNILGTFFVLSGGESAIAWIAVERIHEFSLHPHKIFRK